MPFRVLFAALLLAPALAFAQNNFARADAYADAAPESAERSVPALASYLSRAGGDELTRTRAIYRWLAGHIDYDANGFRTGNYGDLSPEAVLHRRVSVCDGYSHLFQALGLSMGLNVEVVSGWSKGYSYAPGLRFDSRPNHSWNAVRIDGRWRLIDATWGTGYLDERLRFFRDFQEHYFLTAPETFVFDHFPVDPRWQLVARPLSIAEFADLVYLRPMFFQAGFKVVSHSHARIIADDRVTVTLGVTRPVEIMAQVVDPHTDKPIAGEAAFAQVDETHAEINAAFPHGGEYVLRVFAKPSGTEGPLSWVLDYRVDAAHGTKDATFPSLFSGFETHHAWLYESLDGKLQPGQVYRFRLKVPGAIDVILENGGHRTALKRTGDEFSAELSAGRGESVLYARFGAGDDYLGLLKYIGK